tara:strand:+ start:6932 stop:7084 length:153 start_codon:yes stop_codon:yes gene_type:complete
MTSNKYIKINNYPQYTALISSKERTIETLRKYDELELPSCPNFICDELTV